MAALEMSVPVDLHPRRLRVRSPIGELHTRIVPAQDPERPALEGFVRCGFRHHFRAEVASFLPELLGATDGGGTLRGVLGYRCASAGALFLEQYLDQPIEIALARRGLEASRRDAILEVGNLVTEPARVAPALFQAFLVWTTATTRAAWITFTGTRAVRALLCRLGAELVELAPARAERLAGACDAWGAYYAHQPQVVAASLAQLRERLDPASFDPAELNALIERGLEARR